MNGNASSSSESETAAGAGGIGVKYLGDDFNFGFSINLGTAAKVTGSSAKDFVTSILYPSSGLPSVLTEIDYFSLVDIEKDLKLYFGLYGKFIFSAHKWENEISTESEDFITFGLELGPQFTFKQDLFRIGFQPVFSVRVLAGSGVSNYNFIESQNVLGTKETLYMGTILKFFIDYNNQRFFFNVSYYSGMDGENVSGLTEAKIYAGIELLGKLTKL